MNEPSWQDHLAPLVRTLQIIIGALVIGSVALAVSLLEQERQLGG